jgi:hypothetical protein
MALINLKTNLLNLKYGGDKLKGGSSNQPYITTPIPGLQSGYDPNTGQIGYSIGAEDNPPFDVLAARFPDALVRGGLLAPINAGKDVSRLTQYFFDLKSPRGLIFTANQNLLSRTAVKTEASYGVGYGGGAVNEGIYLPTSTLAQVAVQGWTGTHLNKQGLNPLKPTGAYTGDSTLEDILGAGGINTYSEVMKRKKEEDTSNLVVGKYYNRLLQLHRVKIEGLPFVNVPKRDRIPIDTTQNLGSILNYGGGPGSVLGVNNTNIRFASERTGVNNPEIKKNLESDGYFKSTNARRSYKDSLEYDNITRKLGVSNTSIFLKQSLNPNISSRGDNSILGFDIDTGNQTPNNPFGFKQSPANQTLSTFTPSNYNQLYPNTAALTQGGINSKTPIQGGNSILVDDFRKDLDIEKNKTILSFSPNYLINNIENRVSLGDPGSRTKDRSDYTLGGLGGFGGENNIKNALDKITAEPIYEGSYKKLDAASGGATTLNDPNSLNDLATFYIAAYKNDTSANAFYMHFRAFINNFSDSYTPKWNSINYVGRGNTLYNYEGFTRDVKMSFTVAAQSKQELMPMYYKLNYLASTLAPDYTEAGFMRGTLYKMTMGAYLFETPGIITSLNYTIPEQSPWEINIGNSKTESDNSVKELPHIINVDLGFTPIQDFLPRRATDKSGKGSPFISLRNGGDSKSTGNENGYSHYNYYNNSTNIRNEVLDPPISGNNTSVISNLPVNGIPVNLV